MHLIKYNNFQNDPFAEMDRLFKRTLGNSRLPDLFEKHANANRSFRVDVYEDDQDAFQVVAELPGVEKQDVEIQLEKDVLTITAKRKTKQDDSEQTTEYARKLTIGDDVDADKVTAKLENGLLHVVLPKAEHRKPKAITIS